MTVNFAFALGLITSALQAIAVILSWGLTTYFGRRTIYLWGTGFNIVMLVCIGIAASVTQTTGAHYAQAIFGLIVSVFFAFAAAPVSWAIIGETSAIRLRPLTTGIGRASYYIIEIPCIFLGSYMLNPTGANREFFSILPYTLSSNQEIFFTTSYGGSGSSRLTRYADFVLRSRRQMRLRLGRHRALLLDRRVLLPPRDEGPLVPRDRHHVQASHPGAQIQGHGHRRARGRLGGFGFLVVTSRIGCKEACNGRGRLCLHESKKGKCLIPTVLRLCFIP